MIHTNKKHKKNLNINNVIKKVTHMKITTYYNNQNKYIKFNNNANKTII